MTCQICAGNTCLGECEPKITTVITNPPTIQREGWISVKDCPLPTNGFYFLAYRRGEIRSCSYRTDILKQKSFGDSGWSYPNDDLPTHWQPLPAAPIDKG